MERSCRTL
uniref:Uncharacterized protein n=1 Tax=Moniliophthora roreri TaxID=221103 RepID=A0A0W0FMS7_MONRR